MRRHRFIRDIDLTDGTISSKDTSLIHQLKNVLRITVGEEIVLCDGKGKEGIVTITSLSTTELTGELRDLKEELQPQKEITLFVSVLKRENFELVVQKVTEIGVTKIVPIISARTIKTGLNKERLEKIILEASEQSGRTVLPVLGDTLTFTQAVQEGQSVPTRLFFSLGGELWKKNDTGQKEIALFVGPEGGWTEEEISEAKTAGYTIASLGNLTLRGETAAICGSFLATLKK